MAYNYKHFCSLIFIILMISGCQLKKQTSTLQGDEAMSESFTIAFGSCNKASAEQPLWEDIINDNPHLWIWLGDNIYADTDDMMAMQEMYKLQNQNAGYKKLKEITPVIGIWDDHDYGLNDGDKNFPQKKQSRDLALKFLGVNPGQEVWKREGLYQSYTYNYKDLDIRVLLLDGRYFRDPILKGLGGYKGDPDKDLLGKEQWAWLEEELAKEEDILIVGCGIQFIPEEHRYEKWSNFPKSRDRLFDLLDQDATQNIVLLSGDRHLGEISRMDLKTKTIYEVTSSGLTHSYRGENFESNKYRVGENTTDMNYGLLRIEPEGRIQLVLKNPDGKTHLAHNINQEN